ncbi:glutathione S-transferase family protein [Necropsobacter massiliensis]|uniref:glutathione S-transferase family protein n=1 Tax=Necropsobacter massiliensis TaxID=1400001 RepID=UPI000595A00B|nr:glutathione S-transferase family protein [Necropsobacter massiliensis]
MKLYYLPGACSFVPHTALEWIGQPYQAQAVSRDMLKSAEYLALNPLGSVPVLEDGELVLSQNIAILSYLDDVYPDARLFGSKTVRDKAKAMRWLAFFNADVHKAFVPLFRLPNYADANDALGAAVRRDAIQKILAYLSVAHHHLESHIFFGEQISVADIYCYVMLNWCGKLGIDISAFNQFKAFIARVEADNGVQNVRKQEGLA